MTMALRTFEKRWMLSLFAAVLPPSSSTGRLPAGGDSPHLAHFIDEFWRRAPASGKLGLRAATWILALAPLLWRLKLRPFHRLVPKDRQAFLESAAASRLYLVRELPNLVKMVACLAYCALPGVPAAIGLPEVSRDESPPAWIAGHKGTP
jgi:hypothetical protein